MTYAALGLLFAMLGKGFAFFGVQQIVSIVLGVVILVSILLPRKLVSKFQVSKPFYRVYDAVKKRLSFLFSKRNNKALFLIGLLNGLLPCGLVYIAIAGALASPNIVHGVLFMSLFGLGTVPVMFSISFMSNLISIKYRAVLIKIMPYVA